MRPSRISGIAIAAFFAVIPSAFAQTQATKTDTNATQTFTGCLMTEPDYRKAHNLGAGQIGGVGLGDEFVLVDVQSSAAKGTADATQSSGTSGVIASAASSACADKGVAYRLTGTAEEKIKGLVGHQLEVQGRFKHADDVAAGGTQPGEKLPAEVEIVSFREAPSAAAVSEPAPAMSTTTTTPTTPTRAQATMSTPAQPTTPVVTEPSPRATSEPRMPRTASSSALVLLIGVLALSAGIAMGAFRRRAL
jgi:uncharacterized surface anchored protein